MYLAGAVLTLLLIATIIGTNSALLAAHADLSNAPLLASALRVFLFLCAIGTAVTYVAMWYFWASLDDSVTFKKLVWFPILLLFPPIGSSFYCFFVYSRSKVFRPEPLQALAAKE